MSSMPPNMPSGGMPPYDPKTQWRVYREQQRAAWRAQRHAWKANYNGTYGPRVPSMVGPLILIAIGVIALLIRTGRISGADFWAWYAQWWPLLLIAAGLALMAEWALDLRRPTPVRRTGNFIGLLILLAFLGFGAAGWHHMGTWFPQWNGDGSLFNTFGMPEHDSDQPPLSTTLPANAVIDIENPRGDVSITAVDGSAMQVQAHELAFTGSDSDAQKIWQTEAAHLTVNGSSVQVRSNGNGKGRVNLIVTVPRSAKVTVNAGWDDVTATGLGAGMDVTARGDVQLNSISGPVSAHFINGKHNDFSAHDVQGNLTLQGDVDDLTLSEIKGSVTQNGEIPGDVHMENISGPVHLHTSVTTLDVAALPGDLTLNSDDLRVTEATGSVRVTTHAKDVDLSQIYGDTFVENRDGRIAVEPAGSYSVEARNSKGDVEITLPPNASGNVEGHTHNGDIVTDFALQIGGDSDKTVTGKIGAGGPRIFLSSDNGDLGIKRGSSFPPAPTAASAPASARPTVSSRVPHLKSSQALPPHPVTE